MLTVRTRYHTRAGSNAGLHTATCLGLQRSVLDQSAREPHRLAAATLVDHINDRLGTGYALGAQVDSSDDGQIRLFAIVEP